MKPSCLCVLTTGLLLLFFVPSRGDDHTLVSPYGKIAIENNLKSLVVSVDFENATTEEATDALAGMYRRASFRQAVQFYLRSDGIPKTRTVTLKLDNVPFDVALHYVCELGRLRYSIGDDIISIYPRVRSDDGLSVRTFHVDPSFVETVSKAGVIRTAQTPQQ